MELQPSGGRPTVDVENAILQRRKAMKTSFGTQANAILRKNLIFQKRNWASSCCLVSLPIFLCLGLVLLQVLVNLAFSGSDFKCGCKCLETNSAGKCVKKECGLQYSNSNQAGYCSVAHPPEWTPFQQIGKSQYRAVQRNSPYFGELPDPSCRNDVGGCPATILYTGSNKTFADQLGSSLLVKSLTQSVSNYRNKSEAIVLEAVLATSNDPSLSFFFETGVLPGKDEKDVQPSRYLQYACQNSPAFNYSIESTILTASSNISCLSLFSTWRADKSAINKELYAGYYKSRAYGNRIINEYSSAYDFQDSNPKKFNPIIIYNDTIAGLDDAVRGMVRIPRALNLATNAFIRTVVGANFSIPLRFVKEFPKPETKLSLDFSSLLGPLFYMWLILLLYPVILGALVYEKERNLRTMMKMHGLGSLAYWIVTYLYYLILSTVYVLFLVIFGSIIGLKFFRLNSYGLQLIFYFVFVNTQISFAFLSSVIFSKSKVAYVCGYLYVFLFGLLGKFLFEYYLEDTKFPRGAIKAMELFPAFGLYRGLYELGQYAFTGGYLGTDGMMFSNLNDPQNGFKTAVAILAIEWLLFLILSLYLDQVVASGSGIRKHPLYFLKYLGINLNKASKATKGGHLAVEDDGRERPGVAQEKDVVESLGVRSDGYSIVCNNLQKVYPGTDGNPDKFAVREMYLAVARGECFGMLGPNGAGKTTSINMMIGFLAPTSGGAFIEGLDISKDMDTVYSMMGVCPQHDLLWDQLTGREHLLFYGRLKNLKGKALEEAVENSLKSVNLFYGGVGNKVSGAYSGGMKRRLSVAISLIGDPLVVYMDEPSTGLDPASRKSLWSVVKNAKKNRAIILTTHSMEEAEALCDRLGIFVDGRFECIGNPKTLTSLYGGTYVLTVTTPPEEEENVSRIVRSLSPNAKKIYGLSGTQKYELPTHEVDIADVFSIIQREKKRLNIRAWGVANTTLEDVFITIAKNALKPN